MGNRTVPSVAWIGEKKGSSESGDKMSRYRHPVLGRRSSYRSMGGVSNRDFWRMKQPPSTHSFGLGAQGRFRLVTCASVPKT